MVEVDVDFFGVKLDVGMAFHFFGRLALVIGVLVEA